LHAKALVAAIRGITDLPIRHVINTHSHPDHFFGNQFIPGEPEFIAHPRARQEMLQFVAGPATWERREGWSNGDEPRKILPATTTLDGKATYYLGDTIVEVYPMTPSHTWGDLVVSLPQHKVMALGDIAFFKVVPFLIGADPKGWLAACDRIQRMDVETLVPGHGPLGGKPELADMAGYIRLLRVEARKRFDRKLSVGAAAADITLGQYENWAGPEQIVMNVLRFYQEFRGPLSPVPDLAALRHAAEEYNQTIARRNRA
jgi:glyoxylase-like metal-dependent hydrolase (beta-lactamase superfamily II)